MQHEITKPIPLLDDRGNLTEPGWARRPLPVYDRSRVKGGPARRKEWDYYLVMGDGFALALTIADSSCLGVASISLLDFQEGGQVTRSPVRLLPMGATGLPGTSQRGMRRCPAGAMPCCSTTTGRTVLSPPTWSGSGRTRPWTPM